MSHCLMVQLPDSELRVVRCVVDAVLARADQLLATAEDVSLDFNSLSIDSGKSSTH